MTTATGSVGAVAAPRPTGVVGIVTEIRAGIAACRLCPGMRPFRKRPPEAFGTTSTGYMLVAEAPGRAPSFLQEALDDVADGRFRDLGDLFFLADAVRCAPRRNGKGRAPSAPECRTCNPWLRIEVRALRPRLVLAAGSTALRAVMGIPLAIEEVHGRRQRVLDVEVLPLLLPSHRAALARAGMTPSTYRRWLSGLLGSLIDALGA
jgi:DNA polymerase